MYRTRIQTTLALVLTLALLRPPVSYSQQPVAKAAKATPAATTPTTDIGWPRQVVKDGVTLVYYQPQIDEWKDYKTLTADVAFSLTDAAKKQTMGVASIEAGTIVDKEARTVFIRDIKATSIRFPALEEEAKAGMQQAFVNVMPKGGEPISLDRLMADLDHTKVAGKPVPVKNDPPKIFFSSSAAILLLVEGDPVLAPIDKTDLQFVVNSNWDLFHDKDSKKYFLLATDSVWLTASAIKGPWKQATTLPKDMSKLPTNENWDDVKKAIPPRTTGVVVPQVFFSSEPAEMILLQGGPVYTRIAGTQLLFVANTDSDVFVDSKDNMYYLLVSGRWFRARGMNGPWTYAGNDLPADFAKIPSNSPKAYVLASVPGTIEASDAVMLAQVPTTALISRADVESKVKVTYDGAPQFKPIEGTQLQYATNTQDKVIQVGTDYYVCYNAVWLVSTNPNGPWKVADSIPKEIYSIPPSSPVHNVTYVTQTTTPTTVESSSTAGYLGMFMVGTAVGLTIAYGTGYYYPPYYYYPPGFGYPIYRPYPVTYGAAAVYNPRTGAYGVGHAAYGPYGAVGGAAWYNPSTGRYGRAASAQSWYGGRTVASAYNPYTGAYGATSQGHNAYAQWGQSAAVRGDQWARTGHVTTANGTVAGIRSSEGNAAIARGQNGSIAKGSNNTYASKDGNVYRKDSSGNWSQYGGNGNWNSVDTAAAKQQAQQNLQNNPKAQQAQQNLQNRQASGTAQNRAATTQTRPTTSPQTMDRLNQSSAARQRGTTQMQQNRSFGGGSRSFGGGGGFRGGGRRR